MDLNEQEMILALYRHFRSGIIQAAPRYTMPGWRWEGDLVTVSRSGYVTEFECKRTRADFKKDATKAAQINHWSKEGGWSSETLVKHELLAAGDTHGPARFYYATPPGLLTLDEIPSWAGLIEIKSKWCVVIVRKAPEIHREKASEKILRDINATLAWRFWGLTCDKPQLVTVTHFEKEEEHCTSKH